MFFKMQKENNKQYLKPIFSEFEKNYLLSELEMLIENGADCFEFDTLKRNRITVYLRYGRRYYLGFCSGVLSNVLWTLLTTKLIVEDFYCGSYLGFAIEGSIIEPRIGHMTLDLDAKKVKQFFLENDLLKLITERSSNSSKDFLEIINKN